MKLAELVNHYRAKLDILSDAVLIGEIPEGIDEIPDELKKDILDLENYNCITGNPIGNIKFKNFENRWIAKIDLERYGIEKKEIDIEGTQISAGFIEEERIYAGVMIYYNISDLIITKEIAQKFVPIKKHHYLMIKARS